MLSIIIPVLNEASNILKLLRHLEENLVSVASAEIIIVDGGSEDNTVALAKSYATEEGELLIKILEAPKGRARQMNVGAVEAVGAILYFLHADSLPPYGFDEKIRFEVGKGNLAGCFRMKFDEADPVLRVSQWFTRFNHKACRGGDQSLFVTIEVFTKLKGYDERYAIYEDSEFIGRLYDLGNFTVIKDYIITSARRYHKNGTLKLQFHFAVIHFKKWSGADAAALSRYYNKYIIS